MKCEIKNIEKIESFKVDHTKLSRGIFVSRRDFNKSGEVIATTFDVRMKEPNREPVLNIAECHTIEHIGATFLRNHPVWKDETIYFGPMGCRTGFYVIFKGELSSDDVKDIITEMFQFIANFEGDVPGADPYSCGNYLDQNLPMAKFEAKKYLTEILANLKYENLHYPE